MRITEKENKENIEALKVITDKASDINTTLVANEILDWLTVNVEQFIDNTVKTFKIDIVLDGDSEPPMPETRKLQNLYRDIPNDEELVNVKDIMKADGTIDMKKFNSKSVNAAAKTRIAINEVCEECLAKMQHEKEKLQKLYERMIFYYEMVGFHKGSPLLREISGGVNIIKFEYEAFSMDVKVQSPTYKIQREGGEVDTIESETKEYNIPEGFTIWVEIAFASKARSTSIF